MNGSDYKRTKRYGEVWKEVFNRDKSACTLCHSTQNLCIDHILSVSKGGKSTLENMRVLCRSCNTKEGHKSRELDPKLKRKRDYMRTWSKNNPGYFTFKTAEFRKANPMYWTEYSKRQDRLYAKAL